MAPGENEFDTPGIWEDGETFPVALPWKKLSIELFFFISALPLSFSFLLFINLLLLIKLFEEVILILTLPLIKNKIYRSNAFLVQCSSILKGITIAILGEKSIQRKLQYSQCVLT